MPTTKIHVTECDNDLRVIAIQFVGSQELFHIQSGFGDPVDYKFNPSAILPHGGYTLCMVGINTGGPSKFKVAITTDGVENIFESIPTSDVGAVWTQNVNIVSG